MILKVEPLPSEKKLWGRVCKVKTSKGTFETPYRVSTKVEFDSKANIPTDLKIESAFSEAIFEYRHEDVESFLKKNGEFGKRRSNLEAQSDMMEYSHLISYYPKLPQNTNLDMRGMKLFLELQIRSPMPILDLGWDVDLFKSRFDSICKNFVDEKTDTVHIIGFIYRNWWDYIQNFDYIFQNKGKEVLYHCLDVDRTYEISRLRREKAQTMHILQRWGFDTYSIKYRRGGGKKIEDEKEKRNMELKNQDIAQVLMFDRKTIGLFSIDEWKKKYQHTLNCDCQFCHNLSFEDFIDKYGYDTAFGKRSKLKLNYASKLHEYYSSSLEFDESRTAIKEDDLKGYFNKKYFLKQSYGTFFSNE